MIILFSMRYSSGRKLQKYSPLDGAKVWDKPASRKHGYEFNPKPVIELASKLPLPTELDEDGRRNLVQDFIDVCSIQFT